MTPLEGRRLAQFVETTARRIRYAKRRGQSAQAQDLANRYHWRTEHYDVVLVPSGTLRALAYMTAEISAGWHS